MAGSWADEVGPLLAMGVDAQVVAGMDEPNHMNHVYSVPIFMKQRKYEIA